MIKTIEITHFTSPDYVAQALEGSYGLDGRKGIYFTCIKSLVFVNATGPLSFDEKLPENAMPWHLCVCSDSGVRTVPVRDSHLTFELADGETANGSFRIKG